MKLFFLILIFALIWMVIRIFFVASRIRKGGEEMFQRFSMREHEDDTENWTVPENPIEKDISNRGRVIDEKKSDDSS